MTDTKKHDSDSTDSASAPTDRRGFLKAVGLAGAGARRFFAASSRRGRDKRSDYACRVPREHIFGRGFDSRRLHHLTHSTERT